MTSQTTAAGARTPFYYVKDNNGHRWKIREAVSIKAACNAIASARVSGSIGAKYMIDDTLCGGSIRTLADVVRVHGDDFSEQKPYEELRAALAKTGGAA